MKQRLVGIALLVILQGCAALMNTYQTPKTLKPGNINLGFGAGIRLIDQDTRRFKYPIIPAAYYGRIGVLRRVDVGIKTAYNWNEWEFLSFGADVKYQLHQAPFPISVNIGFGTGSKAFEGLGSVDGDLFGDKYHYDGFGEEGVYKYDTKFAGLVAGYKRYYVGVKLIDYFYKQQWTNGSVIAKIDRWIPAFTAGYISREGETVSLLYELDSYFVPKPIVTANIGLQFNF